MTKSANTLEFTFERIISAPPSDVFDGWLNPKIPGNPWNMAEKLLLNPEVDGFFYWLVKGNLALWQVHRDGERNPDAAHLDVSQHLGGRVDRYSDLPTARRRHIDDSRALWPS